MKLEHRLALAFGAISGISGLSVTYYRRIAQPIDEFSVYTSPLQPIMQALHLISSLCLVFSLGWVFGTHVIARMRQDSTGRRSGIALLVSGLVMLISSMPLVIAADVGSNAWINWLHGVGGVAFVAALGIHVLAVRLLGLRRQKDIVAPASPAIWARELDRTV